MRQSPKQIHANPGVPQPTVVNDTDFRPISSRTFLHSVSGTHGERMDAIHQSGSAGIDAGKFTLKPVVCMYPAALDVRQHERDVMSRLAPSQHSERRI
jgi:hypothetical protein